MNRFPTAVGAWIVILVAIVSAKQQPVFRAAVDVARIDVSVMNGLSPVVGLTRDQFVVTDNGVVQSVEAVSMDTAPLDLTLVLDTGTSMRLDRIKQLIEASKTLVGACGLMISRPRHLRRSDCPRQADDPRSHGVGRRARRPRRERIDRLE